MLARDASEASRKLTLPKDPDAYETKLPSDFVAPQGIEFKFNENDPAIKLARDFAHRNGLSQAQFSEMAAVYAQGRIAEMQVLDTALQGEIQKLGAAGAPRVTAVQNWLNATVGPELGAALNKMLFTAKAVEGFEKLIDRVRTQGGGNFQPNRDPPKGNGVIEGFDKMSFEQRRAAQERLRRGAA